MKVKEKIVNILSIIFIVMLFLMAFTFIISHNTDSVTSLKDTWSTLGSFFGGVATLTTAYVASLLFNDWRSEKEYDIKAIYINNAIQKLSEIHSNLIESRSNANNLLKIQNHLILQTDYINQMSVSHKKTLTLLYADLTVVNKLFNKEELITQYFVYDKFISVFDTFNSLLLKEYRTYFYYYIDKYSPNQKNQYINVFRLENNLEEDLPHIINRDKVSNFFKFELGRKMGDIIDTCTYLDHIEECINAHENMVNLCIMQLKAKYSNDPSSVE